MDGANAADPSRENLAAFRDEMGKELPVLEVNVANLLGAELADALAPDRKSLWSWHRIYDPFLRFNYSIGAAGGPASYPLIG
jgi:hypothetical protein